MHIIRLHYDTDKVMEYKWKGWKGYENYIVPRGEYYSGKYELVIEATGEIEIYKPIKGGQERAEKELNPQYLEFIKEDECPECNGTGSIPDPNYPHPGGYQCHNCVDGKIEEVTFTGFFGDMKEYDKRIFDEGHKRGIEYWQDRVKWEAELKESE